MRSIILALPVFIALLPSGARAGSCPEGQYITIDTDGRCCWANQVWLKSRGVCVGVPLCPDGFEVVGERCAKKAVHCANGQTITGDTRGHCCWPKQVWSASRGVCVGFPACPPGLTVIGEECRAPGQDLSTPEAMVPTPTKIAPAPASAAAPAPAPAQIAAPTPAPAPSLEPAPAGVINAPPPVLQVRAPVPVAPVAAKRPFEYHLLFAAVLEGYYFSVPAASGGGLGLGLLGAIETPLTRTPGATTLSVRAGVGLDLTGASAGTPALYLQIPLHLGLSLQIKKAIELALDWQPTLVVVAGSGSAAAMNPTGVALSIDLLWRSKIHPHGTIWLLPPVLGLPLTLGAGLGVAYF